MSTADPDWIRRAAWFESCPPLKEPRPPEGDWIDAWIASCRKRERYPGLYEPDTFNGRWRKHRGILIPVLH